MTRCIVALGALLALLGLLSGSARAQVPPAGPPSVPPGAQAPAAPLLRVFLDCQYECDLEYLRQNVAFIDYVRDRTVADLHVLVTTQSTGGGGTAWTLKFIGQSRFQNQDRTLTFNTTNTATSDDQRKEFARVFRIGLVAYAADTSVAPQLEVIWHKPEQAAQTTAKKDPWHYWLFQLETGGNFSGEESTNNRSYRFGASGNRTTDRWKINVSGNSYYNQNTYKISDALTIKSLSNSSNLGTLIVKSLGPKWSLGGRASVSQSSYSNSAHAISVAPGIEYDFFPYSESSRRSLTILYTIGASAYAYHDLTIYDKLKETVPNHSINGSLSLRQPWGSLSVSSNFSQHLNHLERTRLSISGNTDVRLFKGFSFSVYGEYDKIKDQISLKKEGASPEEVLLRLQQLATRFSYYMGFGINYSFGSIFNNVVNPRFNGG